MGKKSSSIFTLYEHILNELLMKVLTLKVQQWSMHVTVVRPHYLMLSLGSNQRVGMGDMLLLFQGKYYDPSTLSKV